MSLGVQAEGDEQAIFTGPVTDADVMHGYQWGHHNMLLLVALTAHPLFSLYLCRRILMV